MNCKTKKTLLIAGPDDDEHADYVEIIMSQRGYLVERFQSSQYPVNAYITQKLGDGQTEVTYSCGKTNIVDKDFSLVWWRQYTGFHPALDSVHPEDRSIVDFEHRIYSRQFPYQFASNSKWVNSPRGEIDGCNKPLQLRKAIESGLVIPETMITNNREEAVSFLRKARNIGKNVIFKTLISHQWMIRNSPDDYKLGLVYTTRVTENDLVDADVFRICAGIFQYEVDSAFEVRIVFMGDNYVAISHNHREHTDHELDSRRRPPVAGSASRYILPHSVQKNCLAFMRALDLRFGCMDMLVLEDGSHVFLEINPQGAWLWMEHLCSEIKLLIPFCNFLEDGYVSEEDFVRKSNDLIYKDYENNFLYKPKNKRFS